MKKNNRIKLKISQRMSYHLIEGFLIFTSVFFAFLLTEYRKSQKDTATLEISLQHIASEMKYNHKRIAFIFEYHTDLLYEIDSLELQIDSNWEKLDGSDLKCWKGLQTPVLRSTAYQTFLNSNIIDDIEFELAESLSRIYNTQSISERFDKSLMESFMTGSEDFTSLPRLKNLTLAYLSTLPDVMLEYQIVKKNWLNKYGYNFPIKNKALKKVVNKRMLYRIKQ
jgi:hypothetical protein